MKRYRVEIIKNMESVGYIYLDSDSDSIKATSDEAGELAADMDGSCIYGKDGSITELDLVTKPMEFLVGLYKVLRGTYNFAYAAEQVDVWEFPRVGEDRPASLTDYMPDEDEEEVPPHPETHACPVLDTGARPPSQTPNP